MTSLEFKLSKLDELMDVVEATGGPDNCKMITRMRSYRTLMGANWLQADTDLVEYLDGIVADKIPLKNGFVKFLTAQKIDV